MDHFVRKMRRWQILELSLLVGLLIALLWGMWSVNEQRRLADKVVRLHILANSDSEADQALKLRVRDAVLERTEELLRQAEDRAGAEEALRRALPELEALAETAASPYAVQAKLTEGVAFPTREYGAVALPAGEYMALRLTIGIGAGRNWWCVVFPPLCAQTTTDSSVTAMAGLGEDQGLVRRQEGYELKFKSLELWGTLKARFG